MADSNIFNLSYTIKVIGSSTATPLESAPNGAPSSITIGGTAILGASIVDNGNYHTLTVEDDYGDSYSVDIPDSVSIPEYSACTFEQATAGGTIITSAGLNREISDITICYTGSHNSGTDSGSGDDAREDLPLESDYAVNENGTTLEASLNSFEIVIHYKDLEGNIVLPDTKYYDVFWVRRFNEADYINFEIACGEDSKEPIPGTANAYYKITDRVQIQPTIANPQLILSRFEGLISNSGGILYYEGTNTPPLEMEATAFYEVNAFDISIKYNSSHGKVVSTSNTSTEYPPNSTIEGVYKNYPLKLTAIPIGAYVFDYWEVIGVNSQKIYNSKLNYTVTEDITVNCYFKEPIQPEDDRIATNDYINSLFGDENIYVINDDENSPYYEFKCPTKWDIKNPGTDKSRPADIINIVNSYETDQCVKEEDISILDKEILLEFENEDVLNLALSKISIYAAGDDPTKYNSIYEDDIPLIQDWRIEAGSDGGYTQNTTFDIPKNATKVYNRKLKLQVIGYYGTERALKLYTNTNGSYTDRNQSGAVEISGSSGGTSNVKLYQFKFNTFLNSSTNQPRIKIVISK